MTGAATLPLSLLCAALGLALGLAYFAALRASLGLAGRPLVLAVSVAGRLALAGVGFWAAAQAGALPLLGALGGFLVGRWLWLRRVTP